MTAVVYPTHLPCPMAAPVRSTERRLLELSPSQARAVQRDRHAVQSIVWPPMTDAEADDFLEWGAADLSLWGAWFASDWVMPSGAGPHVRRFVAPPRREYIAGGYLRFSADLEVRGRGELPQDLGSSARFIERFVESLTPYTVVTGSGSLFTIVVDGSNALETTPAAAAQSEIRRTTPTILARNVAIKFKVTSFGTDDCARVSLRDAAGNEWFNFVPRREAGAGAGPQRAFLDLDGDGPLAVTDTSVPLNVWHQFRLRIRPGSGNSTARVETLAGVLVKEAAIASARTPMLIERLVIGVDWGANSSGTRFDDIAIYA